MEQKIHSYESDEITVTYDVKRCIHARECVKGLKEVFNPEKRPWIQLRHAAAGDIMDVVERCPTGALHYRHKSGERSEQVLSVNSIQVVPDGPVYIRGNIELQNEKGETLLKDMRMAICRCGRSKNKPLCDNTHKEINFKASDSLSSSSKELVEDNEAEKGLPLIFLKVLKNGPVQVKGTYRLQLSTGTLLLNMP